MSYVPIQDLLSKTNSMYKLVVLASRRARELDSGAPKLVEIDHEKITTVALKEISQGKIKCKEQKK